MDKLPIFEFLIDETLESGVKAVSIVSDPAFGSKFVTFEENKPKPKFIALEKKKRICAGLSLIPNVLVYRKDEIFGDYYGYFSAETIEKIVEKYHEEMNSNKVNLDHNENMFIDAFMVEDFIVNSEERVADLKKLGIEHENIMGAWFTAFKIKDEMAFDAILKNQEAGNNTGFSIEAFLNKIIVSMMNEKKNKKEMKKEKKNILEKIIDLFKDEEKMERVLVPELGFEIEWTEVGQPVQQVIVDEEGNETYAPLGPGEYVTDSGIVVVDEKGFVEVRELPMEEPEVPVEEPMMDPPVLPEEVVEVPIDEVPIEEVPVEEPVVDEPIEDPEVLVTTIGDVVGTKDGEYTIKVKVEGGVVVSAEVSSENDLLKAKVAELSAQKEDLEKKLAEPIGDPILQSVIVKKDFSKMTAYEKTMYKRNLEK